VIALLAIPGGTLAARQTSSSQPDHLRHRFDDPARLAKSFDDPARDAWQLPDRVLEALVLSRDAPMADIGAGTGYFTVRLARAHPKGVVYAVDVEPAMLEHVRARAAAERLPNIQTVQATATSPNLPGPVELVLIVNTYHHLPSRPTYFSDLKKSLTPSARVAVIDFRKDAPEGPPPEFRFEPDRIIGEMKAAGYELDATHDFLPRQHFLIFRVGPR
jgi:FkbM family methyltransferase